jgi:monothiol glutaredoxin
MPRDIMNEIRDEIAANKVVVYMKGTPTFPMCGFSAATVEVLQELGCPFTHVNVLENQEKREAVKAFSNWPTIPQVYVNGKFIGGCDIVRELHASGALDRLVKDALEKADPES